MRTRPCFQGVRQEGADPLILMLVPDFIALYFFLQQNMFRYLQFVALNTVTLYILGKM